MKKVIIFLFLVFGVFSSLYAEDDFYKKGRIDSIRKNSSFDVIYAERWTIILERTRYGPEYYIPMHKASRQDVIRLIKASLPLNPGLNPNRLIPASCPVLMNTKEILFYTENVYIYSGRESSLEYLARKILESPIFILEE